MKSEPMKWNLFSEGHGYAFYIFRKDRNNWGDLFLKPTKDGGYKVTLSMSVNGTKHKEAHKFLSNAKADLMLEILMKQYDPLKMLHQKTIQEALI